MESARPAVVAKLAVILQAASLLLDYPRPASPEVTELVEAALAELPRSGARRQLDRFLSRWSELDAGTAARRTRSRRSTGLGAILLA